jgi:hypothetical protein
VKQEMEICLKGHKESLTEKGLETFLLEKRKEEIALRHEAIRAKIRAIERSKRQLQIAALMGETRLYLESE